MERMQYRSTTLLGLQAELRQRELLADAQPRRTSVQRRQRDRFLLGIRLPWSRRRA